MPTKEKYGSLEDDGDNGHYYSNFASSTIRKLSETSLELNIAKNKLPT